MASAPPMDKIKQFSSAVAVEERQVRSLVMTLGGLIGGNGLGVALLVLVMNKGIAPKEIGTFEAGLYGTSGALIIAGLLLLTHKRLHNLRIPFGAKHGLRALSTILTITVITMMLILGLELTTRIYLQANQINQIYWYTVKRRSGDYSLLLDSPPYQDAAYATPDFIDEVLATQGRTEGSSEDPNIILPNNFEGEFINIIEHQRFTTGQPDFFDHRIYLFGGSTIFNLAVPDEMTIASQLQRMLLAYYGQSYRVENFGVIGATTHQQFLRLQTLTLNPGDVVIFYDGYNDIFKGLTRNHLWMLNLLSKSDFFNFFLKPILAPYLPPFQSPELESLSAGYYQEIVSAEELTTQQGALFLHFLQPSLHTLTGKSAYENQIIEELRTKAKGWHESYLSAYPVLADVHFTLTAEGIIAYDLRDALNPEHREFTGEIFLDDIHVNHLGNQVIADRLFQALQQQLAPK